MARYEYGGYTYAACLLSEPLLLYVPITQLVCTIYSRGKVVGCSYKTTKETHHVICSLAPPMESAAAASTESAEASVESGISTDPVAKPVLLAVIVSFVGASDCFCPDSAMDVRWFPSRSTCVSRLRWSAVDAASCVTWITPRTSPCSAVCDGLRFGSWHLGSPLCEAMTVICKGKEHKYQQKRCMHI